MSNVSPVKTPASPGGPANTTFTSLRSLDEIRAAYEQLKIEEDENELELEGILSRHLGLETEVRNLIEASTHSLAQAEKDSVETTKTISYTATLADGVSAKVKQLDLAKVMF